MKKIRTRFAPSPTGLLHVGGARTALFSYLYAKHYGGDFIVRIEDTDLARNVKNSEKSQLDNLTWLGIIADESPRKPNPQYGPYHQSQKLNHYNELINELLNQTQAYKAYDSTEELQSQKEEQVKKGIFSFRYDPTWLKISDGEIKKRDVTGAYVIRLKLKINKIYAWKDIVRGKIGVNTNDIGDFVIKKQNGYPTYNFAVVVDDYEMAISHVLRGEEHITNTPKQLAIYEAFGWTPPEFGHLTIITNMDGKKLAKRDTNLKQFIGDYRHEGYNSQAIFNFLTMLGWTHPQAKEKMTRQEIIASFDPQRLSKSSAKFDLKKMEWFAKAYMQATPTKVIKLQLSFENKTNEWINLFIDTYKQSAINLQSLKNALKIYNDPPVRPVTKDLVITIFAKELSNQEFSLVGINKAINKTQEISKMKGKNLFMPIRKATTYQNHGPELAKAIYLFGEGVVKERLK